MAATDMPRSLAQWQSFPDGQMFYLLAKLTGMTALSLALAHIGFSVLHRLCLLRVSRNDHKVLGLAIAILVVLHACLFITGVSLRNGHITWHLFVPDLLNGSYNRGLGVGVIGFWILLVGVTIPLIIRRLPRIVHRLAIFAITLGIAHAVWIGTEKTYIFMLIGFFASVIAVGLVFNMRRYAAK